ncbi:MAG: TonB family protein [Gammaproteobacteria bacterium]|nr:TonB family protein [Gammaproteobacteria bacterium]
MKNVIALLLSVCSLIASADFNSALNFYEKQQYDKAFEEFQKLAQLGEKRSQFNLGVMYFQGQHVEKNINKAYAWTKLATESALANAEEKKIHNIITKKVVNMDLAAAEYESLIKNYDSEVLIKRLYPELLEEKKAGKSHDATALKIVEPRYPYDAARRGIQGWVRVRLDLDVKGNPRNIRVIESFPDSTFVSETLKSISKWRFEPARNEQNELIPSFDLGYTLKFRLQGADLTLKKSVYDDLANKAKQGDAPAQFALGYWHEKLSSLEGDVNPTEMYLNSAVQGFASAQYKLGLSLLYGNGCRQDKEKGIAWLTRAAANGQLNAQESLAGLALQTPTRESQLLALSYLDNLQQQGEMSSSATIRLAWLLATSPYEDIANPKRAIKVMDNISWRNYRDTVTENEILAASYAALGDFEEAIDYQEEALDDAEDLDYDVSEIKERLDSYKAKQLWFQKS